MTTVERVGAYGRRAGNVPLPPVVPVDPARPHLTPAEGWRVYAMTSSGVRFCPCKENEAHARKVNTGWRLACEQGNRSFQGDATFVGGMILDPDDRVVDEWGDGCDLVAPRWRTLLRRTTWGKCVTCGVVMWPHRVVLDGACSTCVRVAEAGDPRPSWPGDSLPPRLEEWPKQYGGQGKDKR